MEKLEPTKVIFYYPMLQHMFYNHFFYVLENKMTIKEHKHYNERIITRRYNEYNKLIAINNSHVGRADTSGGEPYLAPAQLQIFLLMIKVFFKHDLKKIIGSVSPKKIIGKK